MRTYVCITVYLLAHAFANGQSNMMKAVVINNNGDSISGNIDYRNWKKNPQTINFINDANEKKSLDPSSIKGFYIPSAGETYASYDVEIDRITSDQDEAIKNNFIDTTLFRKNVFLLQLISHPQMHLYELIFDHKEHFYYQKANEEPVELIHHYVFDDSKSRVQEIVTYQDQLNGLFAGCSAVATRATTIKFTKNNLQDIFLKYLQCIDPGTAVDVKKKDLGTFNVGIIGGVMWNTFNFKGASYIVDENYSSTFSPALGVSFDVGVSRNRHKWHAITELIYKSYTTNTAFTRPYGSGYTATSDVHFKLSFLQLNTLMRYLLLSKGLAKPFIDFGMSNAFMISQHVNKLHTKLSFGEEETVKAIDGPRSYEFSPMGGAGIAIRKATFEARYASNQKGFSPTLAMNVNPGSFQFLFTYQF